MVHQRTMREISAWLKRQGFSANPIESIRHNEDGATAIYLTSIAQPVIMPAPRARKHAQSAKAAPRSDGPKA